MLYYTSSGLLASPSKGLHPSLPSSLGLGNEVRDLTSPSSSSSSSSPTAAAGRPLRKWNPVLREKREESQPTTRRPIPPQQKRERERDHNNVGFLRLKAIQNSLCLQPGQALSLSLHTQRGPEASSPLWMCQPRYIGGGGGGAKTRFAVGRRNVVVVCAIGGSPSAPMMM